MQKFTAAAVGLAVAAVLGAAPSFAQDKADPANGEDIFKKCRACHQVGPDAKNTVGPALNGLFGRKAGSVEGFAYSDANKNSGVTWDEPTFAKYIKDPREFMPGNKMAFAGIKDDLDIADLTAYLKQFDATGKKK
jgi:cytochrome c